MTSRPRSPHLGVTPVRPAARGRRRLRHPPLSGRIFRCRRRRLRARRPLAPPSPRRRPPPARRHQPDHRVRIGWAGDDYDLWTITAAPDAVSAAQWTAIVNQNTPAELVAALTTQLERDWAEDQDRFLALSTGDWTPAVAPLVEAGWTRHGVDRRSVRFISPDGRAGATVDLVQRSDDAGVTLWAGPAGWGTRAEITFSSRTPNHLIATTARAFTDPAPVARWHQNLHPRLAASGHLTPVVPPAPTPRDIRPRIAAATSAPASRPVRRPPWAPSRSGAPPLLPLSCRPARPPPGADLPGALHVSLFAQQFFDDHLTLPYSEATVVGDTYYAQPAPDLPLRLRISFTDTRMHQRFDGLRVEVVHLDHGRIDAQWLSFAEHDAFTARDRRLGTGRREGSYATFTAGRDTDTPPWVGIGVARLRTAIDRYVQVWFPGAPQVRTSPPVSAPVPVPPPAAVSRHR
ncbi:DUF317 domain-containing protein [Streptomyces sp. NPDC058700]|uniref:DUF317 domain-containing protein n=1 Tax=Streptomyces sp. NPDC058700 TaxID=3346607 RepID=UPI003659727E